VDTALSVAQYVLHNEVDVAYGGAPFGEGGALHHIGTRGGRAAWSNPHDAGLVVASMSSEGEEEESRFACDSAPRKLVERVACGENFTNDTENSWVAVDLGEKRTMRVTHYCLRYDDGHDDGRSPTAPYLMNWELQALDAGPRGWITLRQHESDRSLFDGRQWHRQPSAAAFEVTQHTGTAFRHFRVHQHGPNGAGTNYLVCGGLELYGTLFDGATY